MAKKIKVTYSGVTNDAYHDGQLKCNYLYISSPATGPITYQPNGEEPSYEYVLSDAAIRSESPIYISFGASTKFNVNNYEGVYAIIQGGNRFSIYRREYQLYEKYVPSSSGLGVAKETEAYIGEWEPVIISNDNTILRDYNITAGRSYQYILYPESTDDIEQFANTVEFIKDTISEETFRDYRSMGLPVGTSWDEWSITELIPMDNPVDTPTLKKTYQADVKNVWLFKYSLETGAQTQGFQKNEIQTLGRYPKFGYGQANAVSGEVTCLLGSEIIPCTSEVYIERMRASIRTPLSSNEKTYMLRKWRELAFSPNPKLLKDIKGQSWIVQITSSSNTPQNFYKNQPDTISFSWKQIDDVTNVIITGEGLSSPTPGKADSIWYKKKII